VQKTHLNQQFVTVWASCVHGGGIRSTISLVFCFFFNLTPRTALESLTNRSPYIYFFSFKLRARTWRALTKKKLRLRSRKGFLCVRFGIPKTKRPYIDFVLQFRFLGFLQPQTLRKQQREREKKNLEEFRLDPFTTTSCCSDFC
jgi:hypothetical protein